MTQVGVVIAAKDAAATIGRAVASALAQDAVSEVIVVDDGSADGTAAAARCRDDGTGRLRIDILQCNAGPAAARNRGIEISAAPILGILDADDYFLPGRVATLLAAAGTHWDLAADGLIIVREEQPVADGWRRDYRAQVGRDLLSAEAFIQGCLPQARAPRHELAFMKPLIRRAFLDRIGLRYDQHLRLGEDFALYAQALLRGARFVLTPGCGYVAVWRDGSISASHCAQDLFDFSQATLGLMASATPTQRSALLRHARSVALRASYHRALELKQQRKLAALAGFLASNLGAIPYMLRATAQPRTGGGAA